MHKATEYLVPAQHSVVKGTRVRKRVKKGGTKKGKQGCKKGVAGEDFLIQNTK